MFIGEWAESRGIRDQLVIATKVRIPLAQMIGEGLTFFKKNSTLLSTNGATRSKLKQITAETTLNHSKSASKQVSRSFEHTTSISSMSTGGTSTLQSKKL